MRWLRPSCLPDGRADAVSIDWGSQMESALIEGRCRRIQEPIEKDRG